MFSRALTLFGCFVTATALIARAAQSETVPIRRPLSLLPMSLGEWRGIQEPPFDDRTMAILGVDDYLARAYVRSSQAGVGLYIGYYRSQRQGDTIHSPLNCLPGAGWEPLSKSAIRIPVTTTAGGAGEIGVNRYLVQKGLERQLVLYWYQSHGRVVASEYLSKLYLITDAVRLNRTDAALVRITTPIRAEADSGEAQAEREAVRFVQLLFPRLTDHLPL